MILTDQQSEKAWRKIQVALEVAEELLQLRINASSGEGEIGLWASGREDDTAWVFAPIACPTIPSSGAPGHLQYEI